MQETHKAAPARRRAQTNGRMHARACCFVASLSRRASRFASPAVLRLRLSADALASVIRRTALRPPFVQLPSHGRASAAAFLHSFRTRRSVDGCRRV